MEQQSSLADAPFSFYETKSAAVMIRCRGKLAKTIKGKAAVHFLEKIDKLNANEAQLLMARVTAQFKLGNERMASVHDS